MTSRGKYWLPWHILLLSEALVAVASGHIKRLLVMMPPRHGKSRLVSHTFPAWYLGTYPDLRIILASYEATFAASWGRKARDLFEEWAPTIWNLKVNPKVTASSAWGVYRRQGGMDTAGIGGAITGKGAHVLLIDDPVKNADDAQSQTMRDKTWDWYTSTAYTRLESDPEGAIIVVSTRWHEDDLAGRILQDMRDTGERWHVIRLPAVAEEDEVWPHARRAEGEPLWEARFSLPRLAGIRRTLGEYWWSALYQQRPSNEEGAIVKRWWWRYYDAIPYMVDEVVQSWDMTFGKEGPQNDYVVGQVWARVMADLYLLDQVRGRFDLPDTLTQIRRLSSTWPQATLKLIEESANGPAVIQLLRGRVPGLVPVPPRGTKEGRVHAVSPLIEAGNVFLPNPQRTTWVPPFVEEWAQFPFGTHDDQVDAGSQALARLGHMNRAVIGGLIPGFGGVTGRVTKDARRAIML